MSDSLQLHGLQPLSIELSSVHRIFLARILKWVAISYSRGIFPGPGIKSESPALAGRFFTTVPPWEIKVACVHAKSLQSCLTLCDPMDCSPPGSTVQASTLEWVAISFSNLNTLYT